MDTKAILELRNIVKNKGLHGYYKLKKADSVALLLEQSAEEMPTLQPRTKRKKRRPVLSVRIIPRPEEIKNAPSKVFSRVKSSLLGIDDKTRRD